MAHRRSTKVGLDKIDVDDKRISCTTGIIQLKLRPCKPGGTLITKDPSKKGRSVTTRFGESFKNLTNIAWLYLRFKNLVVKRWEHWLETNYDSYVPQQKVERDGNPKVKKSGEPVLEDRWWPDHFDRAVYGLAKTYRQDGELVFVDLPSHLVGEAVRSVRVALSANVPSNHPHGTRNRDKEKSFKKVWQAIRLNERSRPTFARLCLPIKTDKCDLIWSKRTKGGDQFEAVCDKKSIKAGSTHLGRAGLVLRLPLFSVASGRKDKTGFFRLAVGRLEPGNRQIVRNIVCHEPIKDNDGNLTPLRTSDGTVSQWKWRDSRLVFRANKTGKGGKWYLLLTYWRPSKDVGCKPEIKADLVLSPTGGPLRISSGQLTPWSCGGASAFRVYHDLCEDIAKRRFLVRNRRKESSTSSAGHGRNHLFAPLNKLKRGVQLAQINWYGCAIRDVIRYCIRNQCGTLVWRPPGDNLKESKLNQFVLHGLSMDWTAFEQKLRSTCVAFRIQLEVGRKMGIAEFRKIHGLTARQSKDADSNRVAAAAIAELAGDDRCVREPLASEAVNHSGNGSCNRSGDNSV